MNADWAHGELIEEWIAAGLVERSGWDGMPLVRTELPWGVKGVWFDRDAVERVLKFFLLLRQLAGRWRDQPFRLLDWQVEFLIAPAFGWKHPDGSRVTRTVWFEIPRKNGKSTICSGLALYLALADREGAPEVYAAAGDRLQAGIVFRAARSMAAGSPAIRKKLGKGLKQHLIEHDATGAIFRALSSEGDRQHGLNVHGAVIDEVHVHKTPDLVDALETGVGAREQPLVLFITTSDDGKDGSIYATKREYLAGIVGGHIDDPTFYGVVFGADANAEDFDPFSLETLRKANPGCGVTVREDYLHRKAQEAQASPAQLNRYLRLHLNIRTRQTTRWLPMERWDAAAGMVPDELWRDRVAYGGLDLSSTSDLTAFAFVADAGDGEAVLVRPLFWIPEERAEDLERQTGMPLARWRKEGFLRWTEGNVVDYSQVRGDIVAEQERLGIVMTEIAYDPWAASETTQRLEELGYAMVPIRQGYASLSPPSKELERLVMGSTPEQPFLRHNGHPVLRWNADCVEVRADDAGNIKPVKPHRGISGKRIDGMVAVIMGLDRCVRHRGVRPKRSVYEDRGLEIV